MKSDDDAQNPPADEPRAQAEHAQFIRMMYSLGDFNLANSAMIFLGDCDPDEKHSKIELRRFRCYETTAIMSYCRPFTNPSSGSRPLTLKMTGAKLSPDLLETHRTLLALRNKVVAHSDADMMRMVVKSHAMPLREPGEEFVFLETVFDEGLHLYGDLRFKTADLISTVHSSLYRKLLVEAQADPAKFNLRQDYLATSVAPQEPPAPWSGAES